MQPSTWGRPRGLPATNELLALSAVTAAFELLRHMPQLLGLSRMDVGWSAEIMSQQCSNRVSVLPLSGQVKTGHGKVPGT